MSIPLTLFRDWVKQISSEDLNILGRSAIEQAFPQFLGSNPDAEEMRGLDLLAEKLDVVYRRIRSVRRFEGDESLPRERYFSICQGPDGRDGGTLVRELLAYAGSDCLVAVSDLLDPRRHDIFRGLPDRPALAIAFFSIPPTGTLRAFFLEKAREGIPTVVVPYRLFPLTLESVVDLRARSVQHWFFRTFRKGDELFTKLAPSSVNRFEQMLPSLMDGRLGGNEFCNGVGHWLRHRGVRGFVFPSARSNVGVTYNNGDTVQFYGWNLVMYAGAPASAFKSAPFMPDQVIAHKVLDFSPWARGWSAGVQISVVEGGDHHGSWQVRGLEEAQENLFKAKVRAGEWEKWPWTL